MDVASFIQKVTIEKGKDSGNNADGNSNGNNGNNGNIGNLTGSKLALLNRKDHMSYISGRTATQAAPNADITRIEVATILVRFCDTADNSGADYFTDILGSWARQYINQAAKVGLAQGYSDGTFRPDQNITCFEHKGKKSLTEAGQIRKSVYSILRQEQREQQPRRKQDMER